MPKIARATGTQARELSVLAFIQERLLLVKQEADPEELFREAKLLRTKIERHQHCTLAAKPLGLMLAVIGAGVLVQGIYPFSIDTVTAFSIVAVLATSWFLLDFAFKSEARARAGNSVNGRFQYSIKNSELFSDVFEPIKNGDYQLALVSNSNARIGLTPVSRQPIASFVAQGAFLDAWLPAELLSEKTEACAHHADNAPASHYVVIHYSEAHEQPRTRPGRWKQYYLWHVDPGLVENLFAQAGAIYPGKKVERLKAQIAVTMVCEHFKECRQQGEIKSQKQLADMLEERLKFEAVRRRKLNEIDDLEARKLERINLSGERKSVDPADPQAGMGDKPASWFFALLSAENDTILPHLRQQVLKTQPDLPLFI